MPSAAVAVSRPVSTCEAVAGPAKRIIVTHMSADVLEHQDEVSFVPAYDGLVINL